MGTGTGTGTGTGAGPQTAKTGFFSIAADPDLQDTLRIAAKRLTEQTMLARLLMFVSLLNDNCGRMHLLTALQVISLLLRFVSIRFV